MGRRVKSLPYADFQKYNYNLVINFIGCSDPVKLKKLGKSYLEACNKFDDMVLSYLCKHKNSQYIFISSGASYGQIFDKGPANENSKSTFAGMDIANDYYGFTKYLIEKKHSMNQDFRIVDLRVFSYIDKNQDINSSMFLPSLAKAIRMRGVFQTFNNEIFRDYLCSEDLYNLINLLKPSERGVYDLYSAKITSKFEVLESFKDFVIVKLIDDKRNCEQKKYYFSENKLAETLGFKPKYSSIENIKNYIEFVLKQ